MKSLMTSRRSSSRVSRVSQSAEARHDAVCGGWCVALSILSMIASASTPSLARDLSFEERVQAQEAIERVYYGHQIGRTKAFEEVVPYAILEQKVRQYLRKSAALSEFWNSPLTADMLRRETERMIAETALPGRFVELVGALGNDSVLVQECLARAVLADRLASRFFASDNRIHGSARSNAEGLRSALLARSLDPWTQHPARVTIDVISPGEQAQVEIHDEAAHDASYASGRGRGRAAVSPNELSSWEAPVGTTGLRIGPVDETEHAFFVRVWLAHTAGRPQMAVYTVPKRTWSDWWRETRSGFDEKHVRAVAKDDAALSKSLLAMRSATCVPEDTWDNGSMDDIPAQRALHTAVWTGTEMIIWGGSSGDGPTNTGARYDPMIDDWQPISTVGAPAARQLHTAVWTGRAMIVWGGGVGVAFFADGSRYDPVTDTWSSISNENAPTARQSHSAVWTGHEMLVWGAVPGGGKYEPSTDTWRSISEVGAPAPLTGQTVTWIGNEMSVWGGDQGFYDFVSTGFRYNPEADHWTPTSLEGAPEPRAYHSAVWSGDALLVWGGLGSTGRLQSGGAYSPTTDTWSAMSTVGAPPDGHVAVWTGTEMLVRGGESLQTGGRYDPKTDSWQPISAVNAPSVRLNETVVWAGDLMLVWGGYLNPEIATNSGGRYDPVADAWTPLSTTLSLRSGHTATWTGSEMVVWGGAGGGASLATGASYDPATDHWTPTATEGAPTARSGHAAVWTGQDVLVWGGVDGSSTNTGGRYDPRTDVWLSTSTMLAPSGRYSHGMVWTGHEILVWGGERAYEDTADDGGIYNPATATWRPISQVGSPGPRSSYSTVWTGEELIIWGGQDGTGPLNTGRRYDPTTDTWRPVSVSNAPSARTLHSAVWTGKEMIIWGGANHGSLLVTGMRYDPERDRWSFVSTLGAPSGRAGQAAVWTGREMIVWGGAASGGPSYRTDTGGRYDPVADRWLPTSTSNAPEARYDHTGIWTGRSLIVWGGSTQNHYQLNSGGRYFPNDSTDDDADGFRECDGDCNDGLASVFPGATDTCDDIDQDCNGIADDGDADGDGSMVCEDCDDADPSVSPDATETCDGLDQNCNGTIDDGDADGDSHAVCQDCDDSDPELHMGPADVGCLRFLEGKDTLTWCAVRSQDGQATVFDVVRGFVDELPAGGQGTEVCLASRAPVTRIDDGDSPPRGTAYWYLVRARTQCPGSYGYASDGRIRPTAACPN